MAKDDRRWLLAVALVCAFVYVLLSDVLVAHAARSDARIDLISVVNVDECCTWSSWEQRGYIGKRIMWWADHGGMLRRKYMADPDHPGDYIDGGVYVLRSYQWFGPDTSIVLEWDSELRSAESIEFLFIGIHTEDLMLPTETTLLRSEDGLVLTCDSKRVYRLLSAEERKQNYQGPSFTGPFHVVVRFPAGSIVESDEALGFVAPDRIIWKGGDESATQSNRRP